MIYVHQIKKEGSCMCDREESDAVTNGFILAVVQLLNPL